MNKQTRVILMGITAAFAGAVAIALIVRGRKTPPVHHDHPAGKWLKMKRNARKAERVTEMEH